MAIRERSQVCNRPASEWFQYRPRNLASGPCEICDGFAGAGKSLAAHPLSL